MQQRAIGEQLHRTARRMTLADQFRVGKALLEAGARLDFTGAMLAQRLDQRAAQLREGLRVQHHHALVAEPQPAARGRKAHVRDEVQDAGPILCGRRGVAALIAGHGVGLPLSRTGGRSRPISRVGGHRARSVRPGPEASKPARGPKIGNSSLGSAVERA
jgi:hypothetical protein